MDMNSDADASSISLEVQHIRRALELIKIACSRNAYHLEEYEMVGKIYNDFTTFMKTVDSASSMMPAQQQQQQDKPPQLQQ